jgi:MOSC domain-containing protein YiiM
MNRRAEAGGDGTVIAVSRASTHGPRKQTRERVRLVAGSGVEGDAHAGPTVRHRSRVARDPGQPNLRQVHLLGAELHDELRADGLAISPGEMGENVTTRGVDLLALPLGARLQLGESAEVEVTGLRNPCSQLDAIRPGLMAATLDRDERGALVRRAGVMAVVIAGGEVRAGDEVRVRLPPESHAALGPV